MGKMGALREEALGKLIEAKDIAESGEELSASDQRRFDATMAEFHRLDRQVAALGGKTDLPATYEEAIEHYGGAVNGTSHGSMPVMRDASGQAIPWPGSRTSGPVPGLRPSPGASWTEAVLTASGGSSGIMAALLTPSGTAPVSVPLAPLPVTDPRQAQFVAELMPVDEAPGGRFSYLRQTTRVNNAAVVAEGERKPTSIYSLERIDDRTRTVAHLSEPIPRQQINDAGMLRQFLDDELKYGLRLAIDDEIVNGDGTGESMDGILSLATPQAFATDMMTTARKAITRLQAANLAPSAFVLNPADWESIELAAADQFAANSNQPSPADAMARRLWGVPVMVSNGIAAGTGILGDFATSAVLRVTEQARVDWSENVFDPNALGAGVGASDFERNLIRFRAETRVAIAVLRPIGFVALDLTAA